MATECGDTAHQEIAAILTKAIARGVEILLPIDCIISSSLCGTQPSRIIECGDEIPMGMYEMDCGPKTQSVNATAIRESNTIIWSGTLGVYETKEFEAGTKSTMNEIIHATEQGAISFITGRATVKLFQMNHCLGKVTFASTERMPCIMALLSGPLLIRVGNPNPTTRTPPSSFQDRWSRLWNF
jgi:3-phosphoglycerate kinase